MERIWAPWRMDYILDEKPCGCIFCSGGQSDQSRDKLVLYKSPLSLVMLNRYPYTNGHLMVAPLRHTSDLDSLSDEEMLDLFCCVRLCRRVLDVEASPQGFNIGVNLGRAAGAGIEDHLHVHIVPRWNGDTNFMTTVANVRVVPEGLLTAYDRLYPHFVSFAE